jgi:hypothetical protein
VPAVIDVLTLSGDKVSAVTAFLVMDTPAPAPLSRRQKPAEFFASFGLPARVP